MTAAIVAALCVPYGTYRDLPQTDRTLQPIVRLTRAVHSTVCPALHVCRPSQVRRARDSLHRQTCFIKISFIIPLLPHFRTGGIKYFL